MEEDDYITPLSKLPQSFPQPVIPVESPEGNLLLFLSLREVLSFLAMFSLMSLLIGYKVFSYLHKCKNTTQNISSEYEKTEAKIKKANEIIALKTERITTLSRLLTISLILLVSVAVLTLFVKSLQTQLNSLPYQLFVLFLVSLPIFAYAFQKMNASGLESEKEKLATLRKGQQKRLGEVLGALPESMQKDLQAKFVTQSQGSISQNDARIRRLEKECLGVSVDSERHNELLDGLCGFNWCEYCKLLNQEDCSEEFIQCQSNCLGKYFELIRTLSEKRKVLASEMEQRGKEIVMLQEEEKTYEDAVKEAKEDVRFAPKKQQEKLMKATEDFASGAKEAFKQAGIA